MFGVLYVSGIFGAIIYSMIESFLDTKRKIKQNRKVKHVTSWIVRVVVGGIYSFLVHYFNSEGFLLTDLMIMMILYLAQLGGLFWLLFDLQINFHNEWEWEYYGETSKTDKAINWVQSLFKGSAIGLITKLFVIGFSFYTYWRSVQLW